MRDSLYPEGAEKFVYAPGLQRSGIDAELALRGDGQIVGRVSTPTLPLGSGLLSTGKTKLERRTGSSRRI